MYITNVASNEKFEFSKFISIIALFTVVTTPISLFINKIIFQELNFEKSWTNHELFSTIAKFLNSPFNSLFIIVIVYLILTIIIVVKLTNKFEGPLRQKY